MYDDQYRKRFVSLPAATHSGFIDASPDGKDVLFTHVHNHKDFELLLIQSGTSIFKIDGTEVVAEAGDVIVINPYEVHSSYAVANHLPLSFYCITFDLSLLASSPLHPAYHLCERLTNGSVKFHPLIKPCEITTLFAQTQSVFQTKAVGWEYLISSMIFRIFALLIQEERYDSSPAPSKNHIFTMEVQKYIEANLSADISSADAARALSYNNSYFCRLFKRNFGQSFGEYLNFHRIHYARELLRQGYRVADAAYASGFHNLSYFTKLFKLHHGILPSACKYDSSILQS